MQRKPCWIGADLTSISCTKRGGLFSLGCTQARSLCMQSCFPERGAMFRRYLPGIYGPTATRAMA
jgi:hypothetical protein